MTIEVYSFDFDGCLFNYEFLSKKKDFFDANSGLFKKINQSLSDKIFIVGSNRQGLSDDRVNAHADERGSCFPVIQKMSHYLGARLDKFLMTDLYNDLKSGASFDEALKFLDPDTNQYHHDQVKANGPFNNWVHDKSKLTLLYAQIHKMALDNPGQFIEFNFLDDREDILEPLHNYFKNNAEIIPNNVRLNIKCYKGAIDKSGQEFNPLVKEYEPIIGLRPQPDKNYNHTVKYMAEVSIEVMALSKIDLISNKTTSPIQTYKQAEDIKFDMAEIDCIKHYKPELVPAKSELVAQKGSGIRTLFTSLSSRFFKTSEPSSPAPTPITPSPDESPKPSPKPSPIPSPRSSAGLKGRPNSGLNFSSSGHLELGSQISASTGSIPEVGSKFFGKKGSKLIRKSIVDVDFEAPQDESNTSMKGKN